MIKVLGTYKSIGDKIVLVINLTKKPFDKMVKHIRDSMFFSYLNLQSNSRILLSSIGDHLNKEEQQDIFKADIAIEVTIKPPLPKPLHDQLNDWHTWAVLIICDNESLAFSIDKETEFIKERSYISNAQ